MGWLGLTIHKHSFIAGYRFLKAKMDKADF